MEIMNRITVNPHIMGGKPCIRGMRVTVAMIIHLIAEGHTRKEILDAYPYLEDEDITAALNYAAFRVDEKEEPIAV
ncbi:MAG: DUF433 domain-containing protein [Spirochaetota bacterium]